MAEIKLIYKYIFRKTIYHLNFLYEKSRDLCLDKDFSREKPAVGYKASRPYEVDFVLKRIITSGKNILDIGSGKGAVLHIAQRFNFLNIYGVEKDPELYAISLENLHGYEFKNTRIFLTDFQKLPEDFFDDIDVFYLFNPFGAELIEILIKMLLKSKLRKPRNIDIIYKNPVHHEKFIQNKKIRLERPYNFITSNSPIHHYKL